MRKDRIPVPLLHHGFGPNTDHEGPKFTEFLNDLSVSDCFLTLPYQIGSLNRVVLEAIVLPNVKLSFLLSLSRNRLITHR